MDSERRREILTSLVRVPAPDADDLRGPLSSVDGWEDLSRHIRVHGVQGIALPRLVDSGGSVPQDVTERLRETVRADSARNLLHRQTMHAIVDGMGDLPMTQQTIPTPTCQVKKKCFWYY